MSPDALMVAGMAAIIGGLALAAYGVVPARHAPVGTRRERWSIRSLDDAPLSPRHRNLIVVLAIALIVDVMKPASIGFVLPGMRAEYGLPAHTLALLPLSALTGTVVGSLLWGWWGDRVGRRATILFAATLFVGTSICGAMPAFGWNVFMCFIMGASAGGLLPVAVTLLTELLPIRRRGTIVVLVGGIGAVGGYLVASGAAALLEPEFGWRIMWFLNLPTGLLLLLLNRSIPESPRFLLLRGRIDEANQILSRFRAGAATPEPVPSGSAAIPSAVQTFRLLLAPPYLARTAAIALYGAAWGLVNYGFLLWLPLNLKDAGLGNASVDAILARSALLAFPVVLLVAWLYGAWSSKRTLLLAGILTAIALLCFLLLSGAGGAQAHVGLLTLIVIALLVSNNGMASTLSPYSAELYPTRARASGSGVAAGAGKFGGVVGQGALLAHGAPALSAAAVVVSLPILAAVVLLTFQGLETRNQPLI
jgi:putative MFS transporter